MVTETAPEILTTPVSEPTSDTPPQTPGSDSQAVPDGTVSTPESTAGADDFKLEDLPSFKELGEAPPAPSVELPGIDESKLVEQERQQRTSSYVQTLQGLRATGQNTWHNWLVETHGLDDRAATAVMSQVARLVEAQHANYESYALESLKTATKGGLPPEVHAELEKKVFTSRKEQTDFIFKAGQKAKEDEWAAKVATQYVPRNLVAKLVEEARQKTLDTVAEKGIGHFRSPQRGSGTSAATPRTLDLDTAQNAPLSELRQLRERQRAAGG